MEPAFEPRNQRRTRRTVLLVEDEVLLRITTADELRREGFEVLEVANADEALSLLASGLPIDVVFTDIQMPGTMDGLMLAREVRKRHPRARIVITSGGATPDAAADFELFLPKPYRFEELASFLRTSVGDEDGDVTRHGL